MLLAAAVPAARRDAMLGGRIFRWLAPPANFRGASGTKPLAGVVWCQCGNLIRIGAVSPSGMVPHSLHIR
jgi:hypothetical protein